jgi:[ribosomal protein S5]-alanine N-acetyltransferase
MTEPATAPETAIRTARLLLRPFRTDDLAAYTAIRADPETARYLPGGTAGAAEAPERAQRTIAAWGAGAWADGGYAPWAVEHVESGGRLIGHLGLRHLPEIGETELAYLLERPAWGRGFATEGARAAIAFARNRLGLSYLVALAMPQNTASTAVMRRCGFALEGPIRIFGIDGVRYGLPLREPVLSPPARG